MRTIEPPRVAEADNKSRYRIRCETQTCASLLEIPYADLYFFAGIRNIAFYQFRCPHCHRITSIMPKAMRSHQCDVNGNPVVEKSLLWPSYPMLATMQFVRRWIDKIKRQR